MRVGALQNFFLSLFWVDDIHHHCKVLAIFFEKWRNFVMASQMVQILKIAGLFFDTKS